MYGGAGCESLLPGRQQGVEQRLVGFWRRLHECFKNGGGGMEAGDGLAHVQPLKGRRLPLLELAERRSGSVDRLFLAHADGHGGRERFECCGRLAARGRCVRGRCGEFALRLAGKCHEPLGLLEHSLGLLPQVGGAGRVRGGRGRGDL